MPMTEPSAHVVRHADLRLLDLKVTQDGGAVRYLEGGRHGLTTSIFESEIVPGSGPTPHRHPYAEVFILPVHTSVPVVESMLHR